MMPFPHDKVSCVFQLHRGCLGGIWRKHNLYIRVGGEKDYVA